MGRRPRCRWRCGAGSRLAGAALLALGWAVSPAVAQSTLSGGRGTPLVPDADTVPPTHFTTSFGASYAATRGDRFQPAPAGVTFGFWNNLDVGVALQSWSRGDREARGATVDPQFALKLRVLTEAPGRPALALSLRGDHAFLGWDLSPSVILHENRGPLLLTGELGYRLPLRGGPADAAGPFVGLAAGYWLSSSTSLFVQALGEGGPDRRLWLMPGVAWSLLGPDPFEKSRESLRAKARQAVAALESELGVKIDTTPENAQLAATPVAPEPAFAARSELLGAPGRVTFFATGGPALGAGPGWRVLAGIQISSFDEFLQDSDGDGIPDRIDRCPFEPEDWDGYQDEDGCPDDGVEVLRKRALDRLEAAEEQTGRPTTPVPRFRLRVPVGEVPDPGGARREAAPMYQPLDAPPAGPAPAPPPAPPSAPAKSQPRPKKATRREKKATRGDAAAPRAERAAAVLPSPRRTVGAASSGWRFLPADGGYVVDLPVNVVVQGRGRS
jgi:hypothetical protein